MAKIRKTTNIQGFVFFFNFWDGVDDEMIMIIRLTISKFSRFQISNIHISKSVKFAFHRLYFSITPRANLPKFKVKTPKPKHKHLAAPLLGIDPSHPENQQEWYHNKYLSI